MKRIKIEHEFVDVIPDDIKDHTLYITMNYATAIHKCLCGCGRQVVTPLNPTAWKITYDGESVSLFPSIGNWNFPCKSHYFITDGKVRWASQWTAEQIAAVQSKDLMDRKGYYQQKTESSESKAEARKPSFFARILSWLFDQK